MLEFTHASFELAVISIACLLVGAILLCIAFRQRLSECIDACRGSVGSVPPYWEHQKQDGELGLDRSSQHYFDDTFPVPLEHRDAMQDLMNATCSNAAERAFRIVRIVRHENSKLWHRYSKELKQISKLQGRLDLAGSVEPLTTEVLADIDAENAFSTVRPEAGEAYLWYGTRPEIALRLLHDGFGSTAAPRPTELQRLEFFEDTARADEGAASGQGLYDGCYSMLLCRVVLGRQWCADDSDDGGDSDDSSDSRAASDLEASRPPSDSCRPVADSEKIRQRGFDSAVVVSEDKVRKFVPCRWSQVYPEYAIVYERCTPRHVGIEYSSFWRYSQVCISEQLQRAPPYWANCQNTEPFAEMHPVVKFKPRIQQLMENTWQVKFTRDRRGSNGQRIPRGDPNGDMPCGARVLKVMRVENSSMWTSYVIAKKRIRSRRGQCEPLGRHSAYTANALNERERRRLVTDINETYLWHGSSPQAVIAIAEDGFRLDLSGQNRGNMFGRGAYLAECASKADEYATDDPAGHYQGCFAMLLCRVALGRVQTLRDADYEAHERMGPEKEFDSTVGDREEAVGTFREFVVPTREQIYPEYAIIYERVYQNARIR